LWDDGVLKLNYVLTNSDRFKYLNMSFWRLYYHLVWSTKQRLPIITPDKEAELYGYIIGKANYLNCITHAINGTENHIHIVTSIPPNLSISEFIKIIKGSSSRHWNNSFSSEQLYWQEGYGVFSLGSKQLETAVNYVKNQKIHHAQGTAIASLETIIDPLQLVAGE
jgi:putative transposase